MSSDELNAHSAAIATSTSSLHNRVRLWRSLSLSEKKEDLLLLLKAIPENDIYSFMSQLEAMFTDGLLFAPDFCLLIRMASCVSFAIHILRTRSELPILLSAVRVFRTHWWKKSRTLQDLLSECGGTGGLIDVIGSLPVCISTKILRVIGARPHVAKDTDIEAELRTQALEAIIHAAIPFPNSNPTSLLPLQRLASVIFACLIPDASESLLRTFLPSFERSISATIWKALAFRHPLLVSQLVFIQLDAVNVGSKAWANGGILEYPEHLLPAVLALGQTKRAGNNILSECLACYARQVKEGTQVSRTGIFGFRSDVLSRLASNGFTDIALRETHKERNAIQHALNIVEDLAIIHASEGKEDWEWSQVFPVVEYAITQFCRHKEEWVSPRKAQMTSLATEIPTATMLLHAIFKRFQVSVQLFTCPPTFIVSFLGRFPEEARLSFWSIAYFIRFSVDLTDESVTLPPLSNSLLYIMGHTQGESILRRGLEAHGRNFLSGHEIPQSKFSSLDSDVLRELFDTTSASRVGEEYAMDAQSAVLHAAWFGCSIQRWNETLSPNLHAGWGDVQSYVSKFKRLAAHARTGPKRLALLKVVFAIIFLTRTLDLLDDTLTWMAQRFSKDPIVGSGMCKWLYCGQYEYHLPGPVALHTILSSPLARTPRLDEDPNHFIENMKRYFHGAGKILRTVRMFFDSLAAEPGHSIEFNSSLYGNLLVIVLQQRIHLVAGFPDPFLKHEGLREAVFEDLSPLILSHGAMGRLEPCPVPEIYVGSVEISVPCRLWGVVIPWMDDLGAKVDDLYRTAYQSELEEDPQLPFRDFRFWPFEVTLVDDHGRTVKSLPANIDFDITGTHYYRLIESWLFSPHSVLLSEPVDDPDRYPSHGFERLEVYVEDYLTFSKSRDEALGKVERLLSHYGPEFPSKSSANDEGTCHWEDQSLLLLSLPRVREELTHSPHLLDSLIDKILPQYSSSDGPTEVIHYDPLRSLPKPQSAKQSSILSYSTRPTNDDADRTSRVVFMDLLQDLPSPDSPHHKERLAFLMSAYIATVHQLPVWQVPEGHGPISDALRYVRLTDVEAFRHYRRYDDATAVKLLERCLPYLSASDIRNLCVAIAAVPLTDDTRRHTVALIEVIRKYHDPGIFLELSFHVLRDVDSSSWHRRTIVRSLLRSLRSTDALAVLNRFLNSLGILRREQLLKEAQARESRHTNGAGLDVDEPRTKTVLKITTIKMLLELLNTGIQDGVFSEDTCNLAYKIMDLSTHHSVLETVIDVFVQTIRVQAVTSVSTANQLYRVEGLWGHLRSFLQKGVRLAEHVELTDEAWDAALRGDSAMPVIESSHHIANALFKVEIEQFPPSVRELWTEDVLVPLLSGHIANRTKWLKVALSREGGSDEDCAKIYGSFDDTFSVPQYLKTILQHSHGGPTKKCVEALLPILEQRLRVSISRQPFKTLSTLAFDKYRTVKEAQTYLKDVRLLTSHALENDSIAFRTSMSNVVYCIKLPETRLEIVTDLVGVLERTGSDLLSPQNMLFGQDPGAKGSPFSCFLEMLSHLSPEGPSDPQWYTKIRPILVYFLDRAEYLEREQSKSSYNGGACFWPVIISLKVLLLPLPTFSPYQDASDRAEKYANGLIDLAKEIASYPRHHRLFSTYVLPSITSNLRCGFADVLPICRSLTLQCPQNNDSDTRRLCFEVAINLIDSFSKQFKDRPGDPRFEKRDEMLAAWSNDSDGMVRWMTSR